MRRQTPRYERADMVCRIGLTLLLIGIAGCASDAAKSGSSAFDDFAVTDSVEGSDLGKFDAVSTISTWNIRENESQTLLEGLMHPVRASLVPSWTLLPALRLRPFS